jgi:hypothetical protein
MAPAKRHTRAGNLGNLASNEWRAIATKPANPPESLRDASNSLHEFNFAALPETARYRIYHYLGYHTSNDLAFESDSFPAGT